MDEVTGFDADARRVLLKHGPELSIRLPYRRHGARTPTSATTVWEQNAPGLKTIEDAVEIRRRLLLAFEQAEREASFDWPTGPLNFAIIGGGPTGIEHRGCDR